MKLKDFLKDYHSFILFYLFIMIVLSVIVYLDHHLKVSAENIVYMNVLALFLFGIFLASEYFKKKKQLDMIAGLINRQRENIAASLPEPLSGEQKLYFELLQKLDSEYRDKLNGFYQGKKEFSDFMNYWVHEIKTPIAASKLLLENGSKSKEELMNIMEEEILSIENDVEQALYYLRSDSFSNDYFISEINISGFINQIVKKNARSFIAKKIGIELDNLDFMVRSDMKWLSFIVEQILLNALKYTDNHGRIKIYGLINEKEQCLVIEDDGIGVRPEDIGRVFGKGFTGHNGREHLKASGIGLYLSKKLANQLGHDITMESVYSEYTKVLIHFPKLSDYLISSL